MKKIKISIIVSVFLSLCVMSGQAVQFSPEASNRKKINFNLVIGDDGVEGYGKLVIMR